MRDLLVAGVIAISGRVDSRVRLQKLVYLLQRAGFGLGFDDFALRAFGPFSAELASTIDVLSRGIIVETATQASTGPRYSYTTNETNTSTLNDLMIQLFPKSVDTMRSLTTEFCAVGTRDLQVIATALFLREEVGIRDEDKLWAEVRRVKAHLPAKHFTNAKRLLAGWDSRKLFTGCRSGSTGSVC